jgi:hypothetical protein
MRALLLGDVIGRAGRTALRRHLRLIREEHEVCFVAANAENSAGGFGVTRECGEEMLSAGADCLTSGNHVWDNKDGIPYLNQESRLIRPANYPGTAPGSGVFLGTTAEGVRVAVLNLMGRVYMGSLDCPFRKADSILEELRGRADVILVDMHAEVTSEKGAMGCYLDGRVAAVYGTHTHIPTADERVLPGGTAFITDVGMTGPYDSVIGCSKGAVIERFLTQRPVRFSPAESDVWLCGALVDVDESTGKARAITRLQVRDVG